ncbi:MAG TPA: DUF4846 domain-containing protein [Flavisolibacter sp.]|jgi:hypothetical protein|nr:DUF4846 domain-containing protein [Flavisolibacter sp.]
MRGLALFMLFFLQNGKQSTVAHFKNVPSSYRVQKPSDDWHTFLQRLPETRADVLDYTGKPVKDQWKHETVLNFDVGNKDLQQCADALMRIRAEYLYAAHRLDAIGFHFTGGGFYSFSSYCQGIRPVVKGQKIFFLKQSSPVNASHLALRSYLDIVYAYANTISLVKDLKNATRFEVGSVVIHPGSPGHCFMIIDQKIIKGDTVYKLAEGYMPAQSIYVLANTKEPGISPWHHLKKGPIHTASFDFDSYQLMKFE